MKSWDVTFDSKPIPNSCFLFFKNILRKADIHFSSNSQLEFKQNILGFPGLFGNQFGRNETLNFRPIRHLSSNYTTANLTFYGNYNSNTSSHTNIHSTNQKEEKTERGVQELSW